jgi:hypothetical protein
MPLTLQQYAAWLDGRGLSWPAPDALDPPKARPHLQRLPQVRAVLWNVYGTLLAISSGDLLFEHPNAFIMEVALEKTIQEFKMWGSMCRKPGKPSDYLREVYHELLIEQRMVSGGREKYPEVSAELLWEAFVKKLLQKDYRFDAGFYGSLNEFSRKVAYFFHASLQGTVCYDGAAAALRHLAEAGLLQGLLADGQCFTPVQLQRGLTGQDATANLDEWVPPARRILSCDVRGRKPSERLFRQALIVLGEQGVSPSEILHIGSRLTLDLVPAKRFGMRTGLFAGDRSSLQVTQEQLKGPASRPDVLLTQLSQIADVVG